MTWFSKTEFSFYVSPNSHHTHLTLRFSLVGECTRYILKIYSNRGFANSGRILLLNSNSYLRWWHSVEWHLTLMDLWCANSIEPHYAAKTGFIFATGLLNMYNVNLFLFMCTVLFVSIGNWRFQAFQCLFQGWIPSPFSFPELSPIGFHSYGDRKYNVKEFYKEVKEDVPMDVNGLSLQ